MHLKSEAARNCVGRAVVVTRTYAERPELPDMEVTEKAAALVMYVPSDRP